MTEEVDVLIEQARDIAAAVDDRTVLARVYKALIDERRKVRAVQELVHDEYGDLLDPDACGGLIGAVQSCVQPKLLVDTH